jgi:excisionase family DNA binding protein
MTTATVETGNGASPYLTMEQVCDLLHVTRSTIERWVKLGAFPQPLRAGRRLLWVVAEVQAHLSALPRQGQ